MATLTPFHITITNVAGALYEGEAASVSLPGLDGEMMVLAHHEPIISLLKEGTITLKTTSGETQQFEVGKGILEVSKNKVIVLI